MGNRDSENISEVKAYGLREPELLDMGSDFRINLYRKRPVIDAYGVVDPKTIVKSDRIYVINECESDTIDTNSDTIDTNDTVYKEGQIEDILLSIIRENGRITQKQMSLKTGLSLRTIKRMTAGLQRSGKLVRIGNNRSGEWKVKEI